MSLQESVEVHMLWFGVGAGCNPTRVGQLWFFGGCLLGSSRHCPPVFLWCCSGHLLAGVAGVWVVFNVPASPFMWSQEFEGVLKGRVNGIVKIVVKGWVLWVARATWLALGCVLWVACFWGGCPQESS